MTVLTQYFLPSTAPYVTKESNSKYGSRKPELYGVRVGMRITQPTQRLGPPRPTREAWLDPPVYEAQQSEPPQTEVSVNLEK